MVEALEVPEALPATDYGTTPGLLRIQLGSCLNLPTKRLMHDLANIATACNEARNAAARAWLRWREDHPDWTAPPLLDADGNPRHYRNGEAMLLSPIFPVSIDYPPFAVPPKPRKKKAGSRQPEGKIDLKTWLYHHIRHRSPQLPGIVAATLAKEVLGFLTTKTPYNHPGASFYNWQAILNNEINLASCREWTIPVPNGSSALAYGTLFPDGPVRVTSAYHDGHVPQSVQALLRTYGRSSCVLACPLFSSDSGRKERYAVVALQVRQLSGGNRQVVERIAAGWWQFADSKLVYVEEPVYSRRRRETGLRGRWFLHLTYDQPIVDPGLVRDRTARITLLGKGETHPLAIATSIDGRDIRPWSVGCGPLLQATHTRLDQRRRSIQTSYRLAGSGRRQHGRARVFRDTRGITRDVRNLGGNVARLTVAEIIRFCIRYQCGRVHFPDPSPGERARSWFRLRDLPWDWTVFVNRLKQQCTRHHIEFDDTRPAPVRVKRKQRK